MKCVLYRKSFLLSIVFVLTLGNGAIQAANIQEGETLFKQNCSACHKVNGKLVGPQLAGVSQKYAGDMEWLYQWVKNAPGMIQKKDPKAIALWEANNKLAMNAFPTLTNEQIDNILAYVDNQVIAAAAPAQVQGASQTNSPFADPKIYYALLGLLGLLVLIALLLVFITATLVSAVRAKEGARPFQMKDAIGTFQGFLQNKFVLTAISLIVMVGGTVHLTAVGTNVSLHQGYMPEQPIKFSHKLHAGQNQVACEYCHSGVRKSYSATIPSVNVCMNCHKYIAEGPQYGKEEIAKIYEAVGWDPDAAEYSKEPKGVEWVRIHNNPDHSYFNHAQHVAVGGIACQTCHGPVEEMEVVYQYALLSMGWCINCHRETKVKVLGKETDMTAADMGGLNCSRCHY